MRLRILVLIIALLFAACGSGSEEGGTPGPSSSVAPTAAALQIDGAGRYEGELTSGGSLRRFVVHVPESLSTPASLVLIFHGFTSTPAKVEDLSGMTAVADREGFAVVYPAARGALPAWTVNNDLQGDGDLLFVRDLIEALQGTLEVDPDRIYAAGMSNGGGMAARLACDAADLIAAAAPVAGAYSLDGCNPVRPVPMMLFHGTEDHIVPYDGLSVLGFPPVEEWATEWARRARCGEPARTTNVAEDVERRMWPGCEADVELYTVFGGRHGWPGSDRALAEADSTGSINASDLIWEFFRTRPRS